LIKTYKVGGFITLPPLQQAVKILGNETLKLMAAELVKIIRQNASVDGTLRKISRVLRVSSSRLKFCA
jgi:type I restriction enzyme R subunit